MTVAEMIAELQKLPQDDPVKVGMLGTILKRAAADQAWLDARDVEFDDRWNARMEP